jgi:hypothetical protein
MAARSKNWTEECAVISLRMTTPAVFSALRWEWTDELREQAGAKAGQG